MEAYRQSKSPKMSNGGKASPTNMINEVSVSLAEDERDQESSARRQQPGERSTLVYAQESS